MLGIIILLKNTILWGSQAMFLPFWKMFLIVLIKLDRKLSISNSTNMNYDGQFTKFFKEILCVCHYENFYTFQPDSLNTYKCCTLLAMLHGMPWLCCRNVQINNLSWSQFQNCSCYFYSSFLFWKYVQIFCMLISVVFFNKFNK